MKPTASFPALTSAQRLCLDINGYVIIENTLSQEEVSCLRRPATFQVLPKRISD